jgi:hypothetical protein
MGRDSLYDITQSAETHGQKVTTGTWRSPEKTHEIFYQHELLEKTLGAHNWDALGGGMGDGGRRDLRGKSFFVHFAEDGLSVKVVEE